MAVQPAECQSQSTREKTFPLSWFPPQSSPLWKAVHHELSPSVPTLPLSDFIYLHTNATVSRNKDVSTIVDSRLCIHMIAFSLPFLLPMRYLCKDFKLCNLCLCVIIVSIDMAAKKIPGEKPQMSKSYLPNVQ